MFVFDSQPDFQRKSIWRNKIYDVCTLFNEECKVFNTLQQKQSTPEEYAPPLIVDESYSAPCSSKRGKFEHRPLAMFALDRLLSFRK